MCFITKEEQIEVKIYILYIILVKKNKVHLDLIIIFLNSLILILCDLNSKLFPNHSHNSSCCRSSQCMAVQILFFIYFLNPILMTF